MQQRLDFLVIGAQKCATSWLYYCLRDHPDLVLPRRKREVEYLGGKLHTERGSEWYFSLFESASSRQRVGDVSVEYLLDTRSPKAVYAHARDVKFIVSMREPIDRAVSAFYWYMRKGLIPKMSVPEALGAGLRAVDKSPGSGDHQFYLRDMIVRGFYDVQVERYLEHFSLSQFLFVSYDEIQKAPLRTIQSIYAFIGVESTHLPQSLGLRPKQNTHSGFLVHLERLAPKSKIFSKLLDLTNQRAHRLGLKRKKFDMPGGLLEDLLQLYLPHNRKMAEIIAASSNEACAPAAKSLIDWSDK